MQELITYDKLKEKLLSITNKRDQALLCTVYACMARVGEITRSRYKPKTKGLTVEELNSQDNKLEIILTTSKTKRPRKILLFRNRESWLIEVIENWALQVGTGELFPISTRWAEVIFSKYFDIKGKGSGDSSSNDSLHTIHWLRGWRYTHYKRGDVTGRIVESKIASLIGGWVSSATPDKYYDFTQIDDFEKFLENKEEGN